MIMSLEFYKKEKLKKVEANGVLFEIPRDWEITKLKSLSIDIHYGITAKAVENSTKFKLLRTTDIKNYKVDWNSLPYCEIMEKRENLEKYKVRAGDIIVTRAGTVGISALAEKDFNNVVFGSYLIRVKLNTEKVSPQFIHQFMQSNLYWNQISTASAGSTLRNIKLPTLKNLKIPLPPLSEQRKIARVLTTIDKAIEEVEKAIKKGERIKKGLLQELLTKRIGHKEFKETEIGKIPKEWKVVKLGKIVEIYDNERIPLSETQRSKMKGDYPYCGANGILDHINDYIFEGEFVLLAEDGGYWGKFQSSAYIMSGKFWANNHVHILKAIDGVANNRFLMYILNYLDLTPYIVGSTRGKLNQKEMRNIKVPLPPLEEQKKIAEILSKWDRVIELKKAKKKKLERMKKKVMELLLTGKVRIKRNA